MPLQSRPGIEGALLLRLELKEADFWTASFSLKMIFFDVARMDLFNSSLESELVADILLTEEVGARRLDMKLAHRVNVQCLSQGFETLIRFAKS